MDNINSISASLFLMWERFVAYIPQIVGAIIVLIIGIIIANIVGGIVKRILRALHVDTFFKRITLLEGVHSSRFSISNFFGSLVKWLIIIAFLIPTADALGLPQVSNFLNTVLLYIPNVIAAVAILVVGLYLADFLGKTIGGFLQASTIGPGNARMLANIAKYAVIVFSCMAALVQLHIVPQLVEILFAGLVLAIALAFGLGGKDHASDLIRNMRQGK